MDKQKCKILIASVALLFCIAMLAIMVFLEQTVSRSDKETVELCATLSCVDVSSTTESTYIRIDTEAPQLTLYIPPYVTEHLDPNLLDVLVSESIITFRIAIEDKDVALSGNPAMLCTNESSVFSLSEHNTYMSSYVQPMRIIGSVLCDSSLCVMICCLISILCKSKRTCGC